MPDPFEIVGTSPLRKEGEAKVRGAAVYVDDLTLPGMWFGATVRSSIARGRILSIRFGPGVAWDEFAVVTAAEIPGGEHDCPSDQGSSVPRGWLCEPSGGADPVAGASRQGHGDGCGAGGGD